MEFEILDGLTFGHAGKEDKAAILALYRAAIGVPGSTWTYEYPNEEYLEGDFSRGNLFCLKNESGEVVGAISVDADELVDKLGCWSKELEPAIEIARLVVREDYRNKGLARLLIKNMMDEARKRGARSVHYLVSKKNEIWGMRHLEKRLNTCLSGMFPKAEGEGSCRGQAEVSCQFPSMLACPSLHTYTLSFFHYAQWVQFNGKLQLKCLQSSGFLCDCP